jgi:hypothetical protein
LNPADIRITLCKISNIFTLGDRQNYCSKWMIILEAGNMCGSKSRRDGQLACAAAVAPGQVSAEAAAGDEPVANMASYAISPSMILVIHENMINETNNIV